MDEKSWSIIEGEGPIVAAAIHSGHVLRPNLAGLAALSDAERLREEDPFTDRWVTIAPTQIVGLKSRFEIDLNRPRDKAVYLSEDDAWGLTVWKTDPPDQVVAESLATYDAFYKEVESLLHRVVQRHERVVVFDIHSYNHRRKGPDGEPADSEVNPEVNVGTGTMYRRRWVNVVDRFLADLQAFDFNGRSLDVRENVKFFGGNFPKWIHEQFPSSVCVLAVEFKKFFMDEWTGRPDDETIALIEKALRSTTAGVCEELSKL